MPSAEQVRVMVSPSFTTTLRGGCVTEGSSEGGNKLHVCVAVCATGFHNINVIIFFMCTIPE